MQAIEFMKGDSVNTIELVSMESLMKEHENPEWKKKVSMQDLILPGSVEILEAAKAGDGRTDKIQSASEPLTAFTIPWILSASVNSPSSRWITASPTTRIP